MSEKDGQLVVHPEAINQLIEEINAFYNDDFYEDSNAEFCLALEDLVRKYIFREYALPDLFAEKDC